MSEEYNCNEKSMSEIEALASQFEAAWKAERELGEQDTAEATDAADEAAIERTRQFARKIVALSASDTWIMRLKARCFLWGESETFESFAAKASDGSTEAMLVSLFRDLGADSDAKPMEAADAAAIEFEPLPAETLEEARS